MDTFVVVVGNLLSGDNGVRSEAEQTYNQLVSSNWQDVISKLLQCVDPANVSAVPVRKMSGVLLRRILKEKQGDIPEQSNLECQKQLLDCLSKESDNGTSRTLVHILVVTLSNSMNDSQVSAAVLSGIQKTLTDMSSSDNNIKTRSAIQCRSYLFFLEKLAEFSTEMMKSQMGNVLEIIGRCLFDDSGNVDIETQFCAIAIVCSIFLSLKNEELKLDNNLSQLSQRIIPKAIQCIGDAAMSQDSNITPVAVRTIQSLLSLARKCMLPFDEHLGKVCEQLMEIAAANTVDADIRCGSLDLFAEIYRKRCARLSENKMFLETCITALINMQVGDADFYTEWDESEPIAAFDMLQLNAPGVRSSSLLTLINMAAPSLGSERESNAISDVFLSIFFEKIFNILVNCKEPIQIFSCISSIAAISTTQKEKISQNENVLQNVLQIIQPYICMQESNTNTLMLQYAACVCMHEMLNCEDEKGHNTINVQKMILPHLGLIVTNMQKHSTSGAYVVSGASCRVLTAFLQPLCEYQKRRAASEEDDDDDEDIDADYNGNDADCKILLDSINCTMLEGLVTSLVNCLMNCSHVQVQEEAMTALSNVAIVAGVGFGSYYDKILPGIKSVLTNTSNKQGNCNPNGNLRVASMWCIACIAEAVGKERFITDAQEIMQILFTDIAVENGQLDEAEGVFECTKRICGVLGKDFLPFLPHVAKIMLNTIENTENKVNVEDVVEADEKGPKMSNGGDLSMVKEIRGVGAYKITANVFAMQARIAALDAIDGIADTLEEDFAPYVMEAVRVVTPVITDHFNVVAATKASECSASLLNCAVKSLKNDPNEIEGCSKLLVAIITKLLTGLEKSSSSRETQFEKMKASSDIHDLYDILCEGGSTAEAEYRHGLASALERCMRISYFSDSEINSELSQKVSIPLQLIDGVCTVAIECMSTSVTFRFNMHQWIYKSRGFDEESAQEMLEGVNDEEGSLMSDLVDSIGYLIKTFRDNFIPCFDRVVSPFLTQVLKMSSNESFIPSLKHNAICLYDDAIEHCGPQMLKHLQIAFPKMLEYAHSDDTFLRQASLYGIGWAVTNFTDQLRAGANSIIQTLTSVINAPGAKEEENVNATENAISALGKTCIAFDSDLTFWMQNLPLLNDSEEAIFCHKTFVNLLEHDMGNTENRMRLLGSTNKRENLPLVSRVVTDIIKAVETNKSNDEAVDIVDKQTLEKLNNLKAIL